MGKLQILGIVAGIALLGGFAWLQEHDKRLRAEAVIEEQAKQLSNNDKQIAGFVESLDNWNKIYVAKTKKYERDRAETSALLDRKREEINALSSKLYASVPDSVKPLVVDFREACKHGINSVLAVLSACDSLRKAGMDKQVESRKMILDLVGSRDSWKKLYQKERDLKSPNRFWEKVGKLSATVGAVAVVGRFIHIW